MFSQQNMVFRSYILVNLILSSCSLEYGLKKLLKDTSGFTGISTNWQGDCPGTWSFENNAATTCYPKNPQTKNCIQKSEPYSINGINELYVNIETETRNCSALKNHSDCTGKFRVSIYYEKSQTSFVLTDEFPKNIVPLVMENDFFKTEDDVGFSVDRNYKSLKLGFQAPSYCGRITSISLSFYICPANTKALVKFSEAPAPSKISSPLQSFGTCINNAIKTRTSLVLSRKCHYNGSFEVVGSCECEAGYTNFYNSKKCQG